MYISEYEPCHKDGVRELRLWLYAKVKILSRFRLCIYQDSEQLFTTNEPYEHHNDGENEQQMHKASERIRRYDPQEPQDQK